MKQEFLKLIEKNEISELLQLLEAELQFEKLDSLALLKSRFNKLTSSKIRGTVLTEEFNIEYNRIKEGIIKLLNFEHKKDFRTEKNNENSYFSQKGKNNIIIKSNNGNINIR